MKLKEPPTTTSVPISTFILHRKARYKVDNTYQRENTWNRPDEQYFVDTILRGYGMPPIFLHKKEKSQFIVDGQQRLTAIWKFHDNELPLSEKYSKDIINDERNKKKNKNRGAHLYKELNQEWQNRFDGYTVPVTYLEDYDDEEVRDLFRRLQHAKPLVAGEILNAYRGNIVPLMRTLSGHKFFTKIITVKPKRYKHYYFVAILLYFEKEGISEVKPKKIYDFFEKNKNLDENSPVYQKVKRVLRYLVNTFRTATPELSAPPWMITLYLLVSYLIENYSIGKQEDKLRGFFAKFYEEVVNSAHGPETELRNFSEALSKKTNDRSTIQLRHDVILQRCLNALNLKRLDENRLFTRQQKILIFRRDKEKCQICDKKLNFGDPDTQFHHKDDYIKGRQTDIDKGLLVCKNCHLNTLHGKK
jgi:hypothetical protein